jgi:formylglycine-generating enzyme required for sulfatase activity
MEDAKAYVGKLSAKTGKEYRFLSEAEWEYMARAGSTSKYPFGSKESSLCEHGNAADQSTDFDWRNKSCNDGYGKTTSPVGSYQANNFGVHDTVGNVSEWVEDCWHSNYSGAPSDGST